MLMGGLAVGVFSVTAFGIFATSSGADSGSDRIGTISAYSQAGGGGDAMAGMDHGAHKWHSGQAGQGGATPAATQGGAGGAAAAATSPAPEPLAILGNTCDNSKLPLHDGFQAGNKCVTTEFGEVGSTANNPSLIISSAPRQVRVGQSFQIKVSTRNLVRDRFLAAAKGGYYKESSFLNDQSLQRGHFHTACRMLTSRTFAPDPKTGSVFFKATEDGGGAAAPDVVTVDVPTGLPN